jgi:hypothetical protein
MVPKPNTAWSLGSASWLAKLTELARKLTAALSTRNLDDATGVHRRYSPYTAFSLASLPHRISIYGLVARLTAALSTGNLDDATGSIDDVPTGSIDDVPTGSIDDVPPVILPNDFGIAGQL